MRKVLGNNVPGVATFIDRLTYVFNVPIGPLRLKSMNAPHALAYISQPMQVLYAVMNGTSGSEIEGLSLPVDEDFDPGIQLDNLGPKTTPTSTIDVKLWAQTVSFDTC